MAINDTSEESYESILAKAKTDSPISIPSTMERTGEMVEGKVDEKSDRMEEEDGQQVDRQDH